MSTAVMIEKMTLAGSRIRSALTPWAAIPLRLIVGYGFVEHGFAKIARGPDNFAAILQALGVPAPHFMAWVSILTELLGGLAVIVGGLVTLASIPMAMLLIVAIFTVHLPNGFSSVKLVAVTVAGPQFGPVLATRSTFCISRAWPRWFSPEPDPSPWIRFLRREANENGGQTLPRELSTASTPTTATVHAEIWKSPVHGRRRVGGLNLDGDGQGDLAGHWVNSEPLLAGAVEED